MTTQTESKRAKPSKTKKTATPTKTPRQIAFAKLFNLAEKKDIHLILGSQLEGFEYVPCGLPQIDELGLACLGRTAVVYGPEASGKSTLMYRVIASFQEQFPDKVPCLIDVEKRIDPDWMAAQGVDMDSIAIVQKMKTMEEYLNAARQMVCSGMVSLLVIDTISAMTPAIMFEETTSEKNIMNRDHVARDAVKIGQWYRLTNGDLFRNKVACIIVSQARTHGIGGQYTYLGLSGGHMQKCMALKIWQTMPLRGAADSTYKAIQVDGKTVNVLTRFNIRATLEKDTGPNVRRVAILPFIVGSGFDDEASLINSALRHGLVLETSKARYVWDDAGGETIKMHGRAKVLEYFRSHSNEKERLLTLIAESHHAIRGTQEDDEGPIQSQVWAEEPAEG